MSKNTVRQTKVNQFQLLPSSSVPRSSFDRSHGWKGTFDAGYLVPFYVDEVYPGDTFRCKVNMLCRLATPLTPFMDNVYVDTHFFFVPNRLVWEHWQNMMGERVNPDDSIDYLVPMDEAPADGFSVGSLYDYMGIPTGVAGIKASALWRRAYYRIWNEWFRDENLQDSNADGLEVGDRAQVEDFLPLKRAKFHDYFTSCLPWPQKGDAVTLGLTGTQTVSGDAVSFELEPNDSEVLANRFGTIAYSPRTDGAGDPTYQTADLLGYHIFNAQPDPEDASVNATVLGNASVDAQFNYVNNPHVYVDANGATLHGSMDGLYVNTSSDAALLSINDIREGFQMQKFLEREARSGSRYTEIIRSFFGTISPDARLQRPEYLGGSHSRIFVNAVAQTSSTDNTSPQGNLSAYGVCSDSFHGFSKSFTEHGVLIGLVSVRADLTYQQGINRMFSREGRYDFYWPTFAHLGEQAVLNKEIYAQGTEEDDDVFGYQERYAELRYYPSLITGKLRSTYAQSLDIWHLAQKFEELPVLNEEFIQEDPPIDRVIAVPSEPHFVMDAWFDVKAIRALPLYGTPGLVDHF